MGFLCNINTNKRNVDLEVIKETELLRDLGLNNVYNVNTDVEVCREIFLAPEFYVTGATKLNDYFVCPSGYTYLSYMNACVSTTSPYTATTSYTTWIPTGCTTGVTSTVYNLDYAPNIDITFVLTGNTAYTAYTSSNFCYKIFSNQYFVDQNPTGGLTSGSETVNKMIPFNSISGNVVTQTFPEGSLPKTWAQYLIRPYYNFFSKCSPGLFFSQWDNTTQPNTFQSDSDFYFVTVIDPPVPQLSGPGIPPLTNYNFVQDILLADGKTGILGQQATVNNEINYFILKSLPASEIMVFVNGVRMTQGYDYNVINQGVTVPPMIQFLHEIKITDWIVANYIVGQPSSLINTDYSKWFVKTIIVDNITVDANVGYSNQVNYNSVTGNYEVYVDQPIDRSNAVVMNINGVEMVQDQQFFLSTTKDNRLIMDKLYVNPINIGDVISILAVSPTFIFPGNNYGSLPTNSFSAQWTVPTSLPTGVTGNFIVQVADLNSTGYTSVLYQSTTPYVPSLGNYVLQINNITLNQYYKFRVVFEATYSAYANNKITTCSYSEGTFDTTSRYINNTY